jgi:CTP:molybdopterin cytidylyltransferase MocA
MAAHADRTDRELPPGSEPRREPRSDREPGREPGGEPGSVGVPGAAGALRAAGAARVVRAPGPTAPGAVAVFPVVGEPVGLLLAAGGGRRLGLGPKALLPYRGRPLLEHALAVLRDGGCRRVLVVLGAGADEVTRRVGPGDSGLGGWEGVAVVRNDDWESGMGSSLRVGLGALPPDAPAALVSLVDTPGVTPAAVARLLAAHQGGARLAAAAYGGRRAHPVLIGADYWAEAARGAVGDAGARALLAAHADELTLVECGDVARPDDIDTPEAWARWSS